MKIIRVTYWTPFPPEHGPTIYHEKYFKKLGGLAKIFIFVISIFYDYIEIDELD